MFAPKNLVVLGISVAVIVVFGYMLLLMSQPSPYAGIFAAHVKSHNDKAASQVLAMIKSTPESGKLNISRDSLLKYYKSQECFMLKTEIRTHRPPTDAQFLNHGKQLIADVSSKLKTSVSPEMQRKLIGRIESGKNLKYFISKVETSRASTGMLERISRKMMCGA